MFLKFFRFEFAPFAKLALTVELIEFVCLTISTVAVTL
jgi:hypothetical protein